MSLRFVVSALPVLRLERKTPGLQKPENMAKDRFDDRREKSKHSPKTWDCSASQATSPGKYSDSVAHLHWFGEGLPRKTGKCFPFFDFGRM